MLLMQIVHQKTYKCVLEGRDFGVLQFYSMWESRENYESCISKLGTEPGPQQGQARDAPKSELDD